ncbi:pyridoxal phosphate-dependent aminotransferase family protein [Actinomadura fulvescens]|uniref:8-amino-7-oxononanoate synthase n=2 Tax=Actinomadura fulvescens TaxID=46160 RepID=A0ABP6CVA3_9ACTN
MFAKCRDWRLMDEAVAMGVYPYYRPIEMPAGAGEVVVGGRRVVMAGSSDYLALSGDARVRAAAVAAIERLGVGTGGSRLTNGTLALHEELEGRLARFLGHEAAMVVTTGFQANLALSALFGPADEVLADGHVHASLIDAARQGRARLRRFRHNDLGHLARLLERGQADAGRLVLSEGLFSATGDVCDLPGIVKLAERHRVRLCLDIAHDVGVLGAGGRGAAERFGLQSAVDVYTVAFSKGLGGLGGAITGPEPVINYLRHHARAMLFSTSLPPASAAAALAGLGIIEAEPERRRRVLAHAARLSTELAALGLAGVGPGDTPIIAVPVGDAVRCMRLCSTLLDEGVFTLAMIPPSVPEGRSLIRLTVTAAHTDDHIDRILDAFAVVCG